MSEDKPYDDLQILEDVRNTLYKIFQDNPEKTKVGDLLKVIELKKKLSVSGTGEKKFWEMINKLREEELAGPPDPSARRKRPGRGKQKTAARDKSAKEEISQ
ncbi:MAG: hypothetical protein NT002_09450 [candidate division Zixibacteria bacterium]|nr:hypothetical protein [candidate division Zixibacteria bacterium]